MIYSEQLSLRMLAELAGPVQRIVPGNANSRKWVSRRNYRYFLPCDP